MPIPPSSDLMMQQGGPPVRPSGPSLSSLPAEGPPQGGDAGGVTKLVFSLEKAVDTLARAVPGAAAEAGQIKQLLRGIMMKAASGGGGALGAGQGPGAPLA